MTNGTVVEWEDETGIVTGTLVGSIPYSRRVVVYGLFDTVKIFHPRIKLKPVGRDSEWKRKRSATGLFSCRRY